MKTEKISPEHWIKFLNGTLPQPVGEGFFLFQVRWTRRQPIRAGTMASMSSATGKVVTGPSIRNLWPKPIVTAIG